MCYVVAKELVYSFELSEFKFKSRYYTHLHTNALWKVINLLYIDLRPGQDVKIGNAPVSITGASGRGISEYNLDRGRVE